MIQLSAYLDRIGYAGPLRPDLVTLRALHRAHLLAIPYENIDIQLGRSLTTDSLVAFEKLVGRRRGGWCYEMNGALGLVLAAVGFDVTRLAADGSAADSHLVLTVPLQETTYVCDVGFSDGPIEPYPLLDGPFIQEGFEFRVEIAENGRWRFYNHRFGAAPGFLAKAPDEAGLASRCQWLQTSPDSVFVRHAVVFRRVAGGVMSLLDRVLRTVTPTGVTRLEIGSADEYVATLENRFGLDLPEAATLWPAICERHDAHLREAAARKASVHGRSP